MMDIPEILKELTPYTGKFPEQAVRAAIEQRDRIIPDLLRVLEDVAADPLRYSKDPDWMLHIYALHLLAQFREPRAYPLIVKIFSAPGDITYDLAGDTVTEGLKQILASVCGRDLTLLQSLIENPSIDQYVRDAAINALVVLYDTGQLSRDAVVAYFKSLFESKLEREPSLAWSSLVCATADIPAPELIDNVRWAYQAGLPSEDFASLESLEDTLLGRSTDRRELYTLITDTVAEMEGWAAFHLDNDSWDKSEPEDLTDDEMPNVKAIASTPVPEGRAVPVRTSRKVGRNDPCPCGSGLKYKKCCGK
jgi:hypothetical protein